MISMTILYLADDLMFPTNSGGRLELLGAARALRDSGHDLQVVVVYREEPAESDRDTMAFEFPGTIFLKRESFVRSTLRYPLQPYQLSSRRIDQELALLPELELEAVIASHEYMLPAARSVGAATGATVVLRSHNDEIAYSKSLVSHATGLKKIYLLAEWLRLRRMMRKGLLQSADAVALISEADRSAYKDFHGPVQYVPPSLLLPADRVFDMPPESPRLGFLGAMDSSHTEQGLVWFVESVLPLVRAQIPTAELVVAGRRSSAALAALLSATEGVDFRGEVARPEEVYGRTRVFINPIFSGSGVNMKLGGPAQRGIPIVTTPFGVRGLDALARAAVVADTPVDFAEGIVSLLSSRDEWTRRSFACRSALDVHGPDSVADAFISLIASARR